MSDSNSLTLVFAPPKSISTCFETSIRPTYSLLTLPPSLLALLSSPSTSSSLEIRGHTNDAAVLVSPTETYALRGVQNSNSLLLCSSGIGERFGEDEEEEGREIRIERKEGTVVISATLHETLEVIPTVARTDRLESLLRGSEYSGEDAESDVKGQASSSYLTLSALSSLLPASDLAISNALRAHRVVELNNFMRPIPPQYLLQVLPTLLSSLDIGTDMDVDQENSTPIPVEVNKKKSGKGKGKAVEEKVKVDVKPIVEVVVEADLEELISTLDSVDCGEDVAQCILSWFGNESGKGNWKLRIGEIVKEIGIGLLAQGGYKAQSLEKFHTQWKVHASKFKSLCQLTLLSSTSLLSPPLTIPPAITYFPISRLASDPSARFTELFAIKQRWEESEMVRFLDDLVGGEKKKREAMVLKFVRKVKETDGTMVWTPRNLW